MAPVRLSHPILSCPLTPCSVHNGFAIYAAAKSLTALRTMPRGAHVVTGCSAPGACVCGPGEGSAAAPGLHCCGIASSHCEVISWLQYVMSRLPISQDRGCVMEAMSARRK